MREEDSGSVNAGEMEKVLSNLPKINLLLYCKQ
jgi:hypothetical protein